MHGANNTLSSAAWWLRFQKPHKNERQCQSSSVHICTACASARKCAACKFFESSFCRIFTAMIIFGVVPIILPPFFLSITTGSRGKSASFRRPNDMQRCQIWPHRVKSHAYSPSVPSDSGCAVSIGLKSRSRLREDGEQASEHITVATDLGVTMINITAFAPHGARQPASIH